MLLNTSPGLSYMQMVPSQSTIAMHIFHKQIYSHHRNKQEGQDGPVSLTLVTVESKAIVL